MSRLRLPLLLLALAFLALTAQAYVSLRPPLSSSQTTGGGASTVGRASRSNVVVTDDGLLIKNYRPLPPADGPLDVRCALLHISARKALKSGKTEVARRYVSHFALINRMPHSRAQHSSESTELDSSTHSDALHHITASTRSMCTSGRGTGSTTRSRTRSSSGPSSSSAPRTWRRLGSSSRRPRHGAFPLSLCLSMVSKRRAQQQARKQAGTLTYPPTYPIHEPHDRYPTHARLLQAWALFESRYGSLQEARRLIAAAVEHDHSLEPVLKWKLWGAEPFSPYAAKASVA